MKKNLATFRYLKTEAIAKLDGLKSIIRVEYPRKTEWFIVLPAVGESDSVCVLISKVGKAHTVFEEPRVLAAYADRIIA